MLRLMNPEIYYYFRCITQSLFAHGPTVIMSVVSVIGFIDVSKTQYRIHANVVVLN